MTLWLTSDQHFGHANIIKYSGRPFRDVEHMTEELVSRFNHLVTPTDTTWHLGDFSLSEKLVQPILARLNGTHVLIAGNHDACHPSKKRPSTKYLAYGFAEVCAEKRMIVYSNGEPKRVLFTHMPAGDTDDLRYPVYRPDPETFDILIHGHIHERWRYRATPKPMINVGVDQWNYYPVLLSTALSEATGKC